MFWEILKGNPVKAISDMIHISLLRQVNMLWFVLGDGGLTVPVLQPFFFSLRIMFSKCILPGYCSQRQYSIINILFGKLISDISLVWRGGQHHFHWWTNTNLFCVLFLFGQYFISISWQEKYCKVLLRCLFSTLQHQTKDPWTARAVPITSGS